MSHPLQMSLSLTGWNVEGEMLDGIAFELIHSESFDDTLRIKLRFKDGREVLVETELKEGQGILVYDALQQGIGGRGHSGIGVV
jgi:hypothetical protein